MTPQQAFAVRMAERAQYVEVATLRAFGSSWTDAYTDAWQIMDETYDLVMAPDRPVQFLGLRQITGRGPA